MDIDDRVVRRGEITVGALYLFVVDFGHVPGQGLPVYCCEGTPFARVALNTGVAGALDREEFAEGTGLMHSLVTLRGLFQEGLVAAWTLVVVPLHVKYQVILFRPGVVAEVAKVIPDLVVHRLDVLLKFGEVVGAEFALSAFEPRDLEMSYLDVFVDLCGVEFCEKKSDFPEKIVSQVTGGKLVQKSSYSRTGLYTPV